MREYKLKIKFITYKTTYVKIIRIIFIYMIAITNNNVGNSCRSSLYGDAVYSFENIKESVNISTKAKNSQNHFKITDYIPVDSAPMTRHELIRQRLKQWEPILSAAITTTKSPQGNRRKGKRFIIFDDGKGAVKIIFGASFPVTLADRQRSVTVTYNFQIQYVPPPIPLYWWSFYNTSTFSILRRRHMRTLTQKQDEQQQQDTGRIFVYAAIEEYLESHGFPKGNNCLLRAICLVTQRPIIDVNVFHAILNSILRPGKTNIEQKYLDAQMAGHNGVDCIRTFNECSAKNKWLKEIALLTD